MPTLRGLCALCNGRSGDKKRSRSLLLKAMASLVRSGQETSIQWDQPLRGRSSDGFARSQAWTSRFEELIRDVIIELSRLAVNLILDLKLKIKLMPTYQQCLQALILSQWLSNCYQPINVYRYDSQQETIYIQAGEEDSIALIIPPNGEWRFVWI